VTLFKNKIMIAVVSLENRVKRMLSINFQIQNFEDFISGNNCIPNTEEYKRMFKDIMQIDINTFIQYIDKGLIKKKQIENYIINNENNFLH
jgi:hypothetical protein